MSIDGVLLFSGGLDSILAALLLQEQGLNIRCLHYVSPFFGSPRARSRWKQLYGLDVEIADAGPEMVRLVRGWPEHGFGKVMNPCVDCKITLLRLAKRRMEELGGSFIATGEVLGQRPMSQRRDIMNLIRHQAGVDDLLLRPLCAKHLDPTPCELSGLVDRERLLDLHGRGRQEQLNLARHYGLTEIPSPGGGCLLTERENARHYWPLRKYREEPTVEDFRLANCGRQLWHAEEGTACWMVVARNNRDNDRLRAFAAADDLLAGLCDYPGPIALLRDGCRWSEDLLARSCSQFVSYAPRVTQALEQNSALEVRVWLKRADATQTVLTVRPDTERTFLARPDWEEVRAEKHALASKKEEERRAELKLVKEARQKAWLASHPDRTPVQATAPGSAQDAAPNPVPDQDA